MGQFDLQRPQGSAGGVTEADAVARMKLARDVDDQAEPAAAMVDDQHAVIVAERTSEPHHPGGRRSDRCSARCRKREAARANAARVDRREPVGDRGGRGKLISEWRQWGGLLGGKRTWWCRLLIRKLAGDGADRLAISRLASQPLDILAGGQ